MSKTLTTQDLRSLLNRADSEVLRVFQGAMDLCHSRRHFEISAEHLLLRLCDETSDEIARIFSVFKVDRGPIRRAIQRILENLPSGHAMKPALTGQVVDLFRAAANLADELGRPQLSPGLLLLAMVLNPSHLRVNEYTAELERIDADQLRDFFQEIIAAAPGEPATDRSGSAPGTSLAPNSNALAQFTVDITGKAHAGEIDPVFGREHEIRQVVDIFARRRKNNPILVGEPGTGKTAIVEGLALRIVQGEVPPFLSHVKILALDLGLLQAGASVKGEFENRLKNVIKEIRASQTPIITFIDEAHTLIGAGGAAGGSDAANLLKPALARGELRTIAATTWSEYKKYFEKDAALERRFQVVRCDEPTTEVATVMLRGLGDRYAKHHKVAILDEGIRAAVELSHRYISGRFLPDKAVDLLDTAAARVAVALSARPGSLEDLDRRIADIESAIFASRRDEAQGHVIDADELTEIESIREALLSERGALNGRWQKELSAIRTVNELRIKCASGNGARSTCETGQPGDHLEKQGEKPAAFQGEGDTDAGFCTGSDTDPAALRETLRTALSELAGIQGEQPLLHPHVDEAAVASVVADWTGIPVGKMVRDEITSVLNMEQRLRERVVGQDAAISLIAQKLRTGKAGLGNPDQPLGAFLCVGPSGVGKTELALAMADLLFGGDQFLTTINMSEFMEAHTVSQLKGSPPGYVGYGEGGVLTEAVRQHPYSVVLLDEVEKAHPDVMNLFYQVFDKGSLADGEGRVVDFTNTVIVMTSNIGTDVIQSLCETGDDVDFETLRTSIYPHLREHFKPALVARMMVIPFRTLSHETLSDIAKMKFNKVARRLAAAHDASLNVNETVYRTLAERCNQVDVGARQIDHILNEVVLPNLSRQLLEWMVDQQAPSKVSVTVDESGKFVFGFEASI